MPLNEISDIHRHLLDLSIVELLDIVQHSDIFGSDEIDGYTFTAETTATTDTMDVVLAVRGDVVVDYERDLLHVDTLIRGGYRARADRW
jgi:hypothetical protein